MSGLGVRRHLGRERRTAMLLALLVLAVALAITFQVWRVARRDEGRERRADFAFRVREIESRIVQRMHANEQVLRGAQGLFDASAAVGRGEFARYVAALRLSEAYPGIQGVGFALVVPAAARRAHVAAVRREGFPGYDIHPEGERDPYTSIVFLEPFTDRNLRAFGYDMFVEPVRRAAMERARDMGEAALSGRVKLVQETERDVQAGALLYLPVYRAGARTDGVGPRRAALAGWVYSPYRMRDLMRGILGEQRDLDIEIYDGGEAVPEALLFDSRPGPVGCGGDPGCLRAERTLRIAGSRWTLRVRQPHVGDAVERSSLLAAAGASASVALALLVWLLGDGRARALVAARRAGEDLAERRRAAEELEAARHFAQATLDAMPEQICVVDELGVILSVNRSWRELGAAAGSPAGGIAEGESYLEASERASGPGADEARRFAARLRAVLAGLGGSFSFEHERSTPAGRRWFVAWVTPFVDRGHARAVVAHHDVTERRQAEEALRESEERLRLAIAGASEVEWTHDVSTGVRAVGEGWRRLTGRGPESAATTDGWLGQLHPDDREAARVRLQDCLEGRSERLELESRLATADGGWRWVRTLGGVTTRDADGRPLRLAGTVTDIEEVHALQEKLLAATRLASVGTLAAGVAHEINNPLAWVHGGLVRSLDLLAPPEGSEVSAEDRAEIGQILSEALEGTRRIADVVKAMRSLGRPEQAHEVQLVDVRAELLHALQMIRNQLLQKARLELDLPDDLPPVRAHTNELGRVFLNLLVNAGQAIAPGRPEANRIGVSARRHGGEVVVEVADSGAGIPPGVKERIFDAFFTTKPVGQGTGLGLPIARSIVDAAGGHIEVNSADASGATFRVHLPIAMAEAPARVRTTPAPGRSPGRRRVLVVDDEPLVAQSLARWLKRAHDVTVFGSAEEALRRLDAGERWDAMLFDLMMPGLDGVAVHAAIAERHPALLARLAFMTGGAFSQRASAFLDREDVVVLAKPIEPSRLMEIVDELASTREGP